MSSIVTGSWHSRTWDALADPTLPLREPDAGPWLVEGEVFEGGEMAHQEHRDIALGVIGEALRSIFIVPTSHPDEMAWYLASYKTHERVWWRAAFANPVGAPWPRPNLIPAVTLATQADADRLVPGLLKVPAKTRAVIVNGPRGPIDLNCIVTPWDKNPRFNVSLSCLVEGLGHRDEDNKWHDGRPPIDWVVINPDADLVIFPVHIRSLLGQCRAAGIPLWSAVPIDGAIVREFPVGVGPVSQPR